jgi:hypothetical protein
MNARQRSTNCIASSRAGSKSTAPQTERAFRVIRRSRKFMALNARAPVTVSLTSAAGLMSHPVKVIDAATRALIDQALGR